MYSFCSCKPRQNNMVTSEHAMTTLYLGAHFKSPQFPKQCENYHRKFWLFALHPVVINSNTHRPSPLLLEFSPSSPTSHLPSPAPEQFRVLINTDTFASSIPISSSRPFTVWWWHAKAHFSSHPLYDLFQCILLKLTLFQTIILFAPSSK